MSDIISLIDGNSILRMRTLKGDDEWTPPDGYTAIEADGHIGQRWNGAAFVDAPAPPAPDPVEKLRDFLAANPDVLAAIGK